MGKPKVVLSPCPPKKENVLETSAQKFSSRIGWAFSQLEVCISIKLGTVLYETLLKGFIHVFKEGEKAVKKSVPFLEQQRASPLNKDLFLHGECVPFHCRGNLGGPEITVNDILLQNHICPDKKEHDWDELVSLAKRVRLEASNRQTAWEQSVFCFGLMASRPGSDSNYGGSQV